MGVERRNVSPPTSGWVGVLRRNVLASYLGVGGSREGKYDNLLPRCRWMLGGMC